MSFFKEQIAWYKLNIINIQSICRANITYYKSFSAFVSNSA